jgi:hypothetical protein
MSHQRTTAFSLSMMLPVLCDIKTRTYHRVSADLCVDCFCAAEGLSGIRDAAEALEIVDIDGDGKIGLLDFIHFAARLQLMYQVRVAFLCAQIHVVISACIEKSDDSCSE